MLCFPPQNFAHTHLGTVLLLNAYSWQLFTWLPELPEIEHTYFCNGLVSMSTFAWEYWEISAWNQFFPIFSAYLLLWKAETNYLEVQHQMVWNQGCVWDSSSSTDLVKSFIASLFRGAAVVINSEMPQHKTIKHLPSIHNSSSMKKKWSYEWPTPPNLWSWSCPKHTQLLCLSVCCCDLLPLILYMYLTWAK